MKKRVFTAVLCFLLVILFQVFLYYGCWFLRRDCLCYQAMFHYGENLPIDDVVVRYTIPKPGVMAIQIIECEHGQRMWLSITKEYYCVQWFNKKGG